MFRFGLGYGTGRYTQRRLVIEAEHPVVFQFPQEVLREIEPQAGFAKHRAQLIDIRRRHFRLQTTNSPNIPYNANRGGLDCQER